MSIQQKSGKTQIRTLMHLIEMTDKELEKANREYDANEEKMNEHRAKRLRIPEDCQALRNNLLDKIEREEEEKRNYKRQIEMLETRFRQAQQTFLKIRSGAFRKAVSCFRLRLDEIEKKVAEEQQRQALQQQLLLLQQQTEAESRRKEIGSVSTQDATTTLPAAATTDPTTPMGATSPTMGYLNEFLIIDGEGGYDTSLTNIPRSPMASRGSQTPTTTSTDPPPATTITQSASAHSQPTGPSLPAGPVLSTSAPHLEASRKRMAPLEANDSAKRIRLELSRLLSLPKAMQIQWIVNFLHLNPVEVTEGQLISMYTMANASKLTVPAPQMLPANDGDKILWCGTITPNPALAPNSGILRPTIPATFQLAAGFGPPTTTLQRPFHPHANMGARPLTSGQPPRHTGLIHQVGSFLKFISTKLYFSLNFNK